MRLLRIPLLIGFHSARDGGYYALITALLGIVASLFTPVNSGLVAGLSTLFIMFVVTGAIGSLLAIWEESRRSIPIDDGLDVW